MPWLPGLAKPDLRLVECAIPRLVALAFAIRRQRSHVRIASGAPKSLCLQTDAYPQTETAALTCSRASKQPRSRSRILRHARHGAVNSPSL